jgi:hypothetical protein
MSWRHQRRETITRLVTVKSFQVIFVAGPGILKSGGRGKRHTSSREPIKEKIAANQCPVCYRYGARNLLHVA